MGMPYDAKICAIPANVHVHVSTNSYRSLGDNTTSL